MSRGLAQNHWNTMGKVQTEQQVKHSVLSGVNCSYLETFSWIQVQQWTHDEAKRDLDFYLHHLKQVLLIVKIEWLYSLMSRKRKQKEIPKAHPSTRAASKLAKTIQVRFVRYLETSGNRTATRWMIKQKPKSRISVLKKNSTKSLAVY